VKIIFICTKSITFNTFLRSQANYFIKKGFQVEVACSDSKKLNFRDDLTYQIDFPNKTTDLLNLIKYIKIFIQIIILVKKNPTAIFYLHTPLASHLFRLLTFLRKLKIIYFVHGFRFTPITNPIKAFFFKTIEKILSFKTDIFITINNEDFNYAKFNLDKKNSCYKINGVGLNLPKKNLRKKTINRNGIKKILVIAAYKKEKGYLELLKVAKMLKNKKIKIECYGYGDCYKFNSIKIKKKINNIYFNNFDINLESKIHQFDILLHLSKREGLPVSVMQSLLAGLPVICYNIRGNNDLVKDRYNGYLVKSYKDVPNIIYYLNLEDKIFNKMRLNAFKSINKDFLKKKINLSIYNIIKDYSKH
jgi:glycosyltransferase involved in cell wall biosynthesis